MSSARLVRNFSIIAHIDHGKTTLTDRLLEQCGQVDHQHVHDRVMDSNPIEQERGITIKLAPVRLNYLAKDSQRYTLNLIDTPGHVDFGYEVSRSLAACEGVLLVVDASQGIQAQTLSTFYKAVDLGLKVIPVINKIDLPSAEVDRVLLEVMELCKVSEDEILRVSAKSGLNIETVLEAVIERIYPPEDTIDKPLRALLISSYFDQHQGAIALVRIVDGRLRPEKLQFIQSGTSFFPAEIGIYTPKQEKISELTSGEVGYVVTTLKDVRSLKIGDTLTVASRPATETLPGYKEPQPLVFFELYPIDAADYSALLDGLEKLALRDAAIQYSNTHSSALGSGTRVGCLGLLHAEIVVERLKLEAGLDLLVTRPTVPHTITLTDGSEKVVRTAQEFPDPSSIASVTEPMVAATLITPVKYMSKILDLVRERRGRYDSSDHLGDRVVLHCTMPLSELITDLHDVIKSVSSGYCSLEYEVSGHQEVDAVLVSILLNGEEVPPLGFISVRDYAASRGRKLVAQLKDLIPRQLFSVPVQATIGGNVIARETISALRKDVTAKLYGGDVTRRKKLLAKQAKGKKRMKAFGSVHLDQDVYLQLLRKPL